MQKRNSIFFIGDLLINQSTKEFYEINSKMVLRKATDIECNLIREDLKSFFSITIFEKGFNPYENDYIKERIAEFQSRTVFKPRERDNWFYWVIESQSGISIGIEKYLPLSTSDLHILCGYNYSTGGIDPTKNVITKVKSDDVNISVFYSNLRYFDFTPKYIDNNVVDNIKSILASVENFKKNEANKNQLIIKSLDDFF